ncbi:hypothetical protein NHQ30_001315 [Ciborinia camelliae]|nr:hypothetical protein NHQ30_001315 [Ciborinia camelliae]
MPELISAHPSQRLNPPFAALEAPYRPPGRLNFERIEALLDARQVAAKDHIWEDPGYFAGLLNERVIAPDPLRYSDFDQSKGREALDKRPNRASIKTKRKAKKALDNIWEYDNQYDLKVSEQATLIDTLQNFSQT